MKKYEKFDQKLHFSDVSNFHKNIALQNFWILIMSSKGFESNQPLLHNAITILEATEQIRLPWWNHWVKSKQMSFFSGRVTFFLNIKGSLPSANSKASSVTTGWSLQAAALLNCDKFFTVDVLFMGKPKSGWKISISHNGEFQAFVAF